MDLEEMRKRAEEGAALAERAHPLPWTFHNDERGAWITATHFPEGHPAYSSWDACFIQIGPDSGPFIADARTRVPALVGDVLALIAEVERLRGEKSTLTAMEEHAREERDAAKAEVERLRAILAANEAEAQRSAAIADANTARGAAIRERKLGA